MPSPSGFAQRTISRQLSDPSGFLGSLVARMLNRENRAAIAAAVASLGPVEGAAVADIGFGGGIGLELLLDAVGPTGHVYGVDPSPDMVKRARRTYRSRVELHEATMQQLPFGDGALGGWISLNTVYFVTELAPAFLELARVLSPGAPGVVGIADPEWMASQSFTGSHFTLRPVDELVAALDAAGLDVEHRRVAEARMTYHLLVCRRR